MDHLRFSHATPRDQERALAQILKSDPLIWRALLHARDMNLPDWLIVSGAIYNSVWNHLTSRPSGHGIKDIDLFYFDGQDLSYEAEDRIIQHGVSHFSALPLPVEIRNQARVHLWYSERFGRQCPEYNSSVQALQYFASKTHAVGVRLDDADEIEVFAPFGLEPIFSFRITPNYAIDNRETYMEKASRATALWPEIIVEDWH